GLTRKTARKRVNPPGQHGQAPRKLSEYAKRLEEKQKLRYNYGVSERQLLRYVRKARRVKGSTGLALLQLLEMRLDNTVFRLGMAPTIPAARQLVSHGHIQVNGQTVYTPSYECKPGDVITVRPRESSRKLVAAYAEYPGLATLPTHLEFDKNRLEGRVTGVVERQCVALQVNELLVVEFYSRKA
ncbi:MAG: 30S ribosomal protein S4, partial [Gloeomargarita sp. HHBFW_bins_205]